MTETLAAALAPTRRLQWLTATLVEGRAETAAARTLVFSAPGWLGHLAGQHVDVRLSAEDGYRAQRSYSIAAPADGDRLELTVQKVVDGEVSSYFVDEMRAGDQIELRGPIGGWFAWHPESSEPVLLVAGGSGIVPLMAMVRERARAGSAVPFRLIYSVRTAADVFYADELRGLGAAAGLRVDLLYTRSAPAGASRPPGRIGVADLADDRAAAAAGLRVRPDRLRRAMRPSCCSCWAILRPTSGPNASDRPGCERGGR